MKRRTQRKLIAASLFIVIALQISIIYMIFNENQSEQYLQERISSIKNETNVNYVAKNAIPAVVSILTEDKSGSGIIVSNDGYIITNAHVIAGSKNITVSLSDKRIFKASLIGADAQVDVALLRINSSNMPIIEFGDSDAVEVGDKVIAIGNPFGFDSTVTTGIISAKHRERGPTEYKDFLQTDASINPGNSGGPLIDSQGRLIGITTFIVADVRTGELGFAIPSNLIKIIMDRLIKYGKIERSYIGVSLQDKMAIDSNGEGKILDGAEIVSFDQKGPAIKSGLKIGDIIIKINDYNVADTNSLRNYIAWIPVEDAINITVMRDSREIMFTVKTVLRPSAF